MRFRKDVVALSEHRSFPHIFFIKLWFSACIIQQYNHDLLCFLMTTKTLEREFNHFNRDDHVFFDLEKVN